MTQERLSTIATLCILVVTPSVLGLSWPVNPIDDPAVRTAAAALYGPVPLQTYVATDPAFQAAFPSLDLFVVQAQSAMPLTHAMARHAATNKSYDVTKDFNKILADLGTSIPNASQALLVGKAMAQAGNPELQARREVVSSADSAALNYTVADPRAEFAGGDWFVNLTTWSPENGVVANWTIRFRAHRLLDAQWEVVAMGHGTFRPDFEAFAFRNGTIVRDT